MCDQLAAKFLALSPVAPRFSRLLHSGVGVAYQLLGFGQGTVRHDDADAARYREVAARFQAGSTDRPDGPVAYEADGRCRPGYLPAGSGMLSTVKVQPHEVLTPKL
jgi:hypothetical protein